MGAAWRPWPGLAQAGLSGENKMDSRKAGIQFFIPAPHLVFFPGEKVDSYETLFFALVQKQISGAKRN